MCKTQGERERERERKRERERERERELRSKIADTTAHEHFCWDYVHIGALVPTCPTDPTSRHAPRLHMLPLNAAM
jgi:hypothetical protein